MTEAAIRGAKREGIFNFRRPGKQGRSMPRPNEGPLLNDFALGADDVNFAEV
jgi:hypothetical protein